MGAFTPQTRTSRDADAPTLRSDEPGTLIRVLRKVLVEGYGTADQPSPALGWEMVQREDGKRAAFRPTDPNHPGGWLYLDEDDPERPSHDAIAVGYRTFSGFDSDGAPDADGVFEEGAWRRGRTEGQGTLDWIIRGNALFFYVWLGTSSAVDDLAVSLSARDMDADGQDNYAWSWTVYCFGRLAGAPGDGGNVVMNTGATSSSNDYSQASNSRLAGRPRGDRIAYLLGDHAGQATGLEARGQYAFHGDRPGDAGPEFPDPIHGLVIDRLQVLDDQGYYRGHLPGLWVPHHDLVYDHARLEPLDTTEPRYIVTPLGTGVGSLQSSAQCACLIDTGEDWHP
ncbi:hypothetical protein [Thioalkalivibrio sp. ALgr3]|uniref:hypothetical protein n=1 Tax=Thioalkalivibrio sp. ALgr3 TaxID=1239292 RepID=UPI00036D5B70|nr:hypothetical protein [Thioalkalivibrio sp. ALgr3]